MASSATPSAPGRVERHTSRSHPSGLKTTTAFDSRKVRALSRKAALGALCSAGPMLYAIQLEDDTIMLGRSADVANRVAYHGGQLLVVARGTESDEQQLHDQLAAHRITGKRYRPNPELIAWINQQRTRLGAKPI